MRHGWEPAAEAPSVEFGNQKRSRAMATTMGQARAGIGQPASIQLPRIVLGVGMGGFVDGILLHQLLQWHHMLSSTNEDHTTPSPDSHDDLDHAVREGALSAADRAQIEAALSDLGYTLIPLRLLH